MHAALKVDGDLLMASDDPTTDKFGPVQGMQVNYAVADVDEARRVFDALGGRRRRHHAGRRDLLVAAVRDVRRSIRNAVDGQRRRARRDRMS
jgi:hypothetical protein